eukprot:m.54931 g.54931  ORF g.54931 m.54931 type:complete len:53 (-) comp12493_c0_seq2:71-229(-)
MTGADAVAHVSGATACTSSCAGGRSTVVSGHTTRQGFCQQGTQTSAPTELWL